MAKTTPKDPAPEPEDNSLENLKALADAPENIPVPEEPVPDAVIVFKEVDAEGNLHTRVSVNGNVQQTEIETLLGLGLKAWRQHLGV